MMYFCNIYNFENHCVVLYHRTTQQRKILFGKIANLNSVSLFEQSKQKLINDREEQ